MKTPKSRDEVLALAYPWYRRGDVNAAIGTLLRALRDSDTDVDLILTLTTWMAEADRFEEAERWIEHALTVVPGDLKVRAHQGAILGLAGRFGEARDVLQSVRQEARVMLAATSNDGQEQQWLPDFIAVTELNLARAAFETGDNNLARDLAEPWLADRQRWRFAHDLLADVIERQGLDVKQLAEDRLASGRVSLVMACVLLEKVVDSVPCDLSELGRLVARLNGCFEFDWTNATPELKAVLGRARPIVSDAIERGEVDFKTWASFLGDHVPMVLEAVTVHVERLEPHLRKTSWPPMTYMMIPSLLKQTDALIQKVAHHLEQHDNPAMAAQLWRLRLLRRSFRRVG